MTAPVGYADFAEHNTRELLRMGWLLTGDWADAEDLMQTTLAHAFVHWTTVEAAHRPAWVRSLLLRTYIHSRVDQPDDTTDPLQQALSGLSRRQRAVVVLRYYVGLTEQHISGELRCSPTAVHRDAAAAHDRLRGIADETSDTAAMQARVRQLTPDPPSDTTVRAAGGGGFVVPGTRPTSVWVAFALTALLVALLAAIVLAIRHPGPETGAGLPPASSSTVQTK